ncbi:MAG TPA: helix-turn-helix transcriptional regulator [Oxalicibacterium sp.]|nr:helix-turn-helix transcriptional regulator [Oxalicibacterium sp.]
MIVSATRYTRGTRLGLHVHREAQLLYASSGIMQVTTPKGRWLVPPARAVWLPPGIEHAVDVLADIEMRALLVPPSWLATHPEAGRLQREFVVSVRPLLRETILAAFRDDNDLQRIGLLVAMALYELAEDEDAATFMPLPTDPRARRVADLVLADPAGTQDLDLLAQEAGASARTITRLFPAETDLTFKAWRQRARIMSAVETLGSGHTSIKRLASQLGFSSVAAFSHAFRQVMGMTPGEMMRKTDAPD